MPTNTRGAGLGTNLWSDVTAWSTGAMPVAGEDVDLNGYVVALDVATIPATGTLASIISPAKAGQLTINLLTLGDCTINATAITCGTAVGLILVSGAAPANTLTINGNITGGTVSSARGLQNNSTGTIIVNGNVTGGSAGSCFGLLNFAQGFAIINGNLYGGSGGTSYGVHNNSTGSVTVTGTVTGGSNLNTFGLYNGSSGSVVVTGNIVAGSGQLACGLYNNFTGVVTLNNCNLINSANSVAYVGKPPTWNLNANNYQQWGTVYFAQQLLDHQILTGVVNGTITGNRVDCPVAKAVTTSGNYGDPDSPFVGTVVEKNYPIIGGSHIIKPARAA